MNFIFRLTRFINMENPNIPSSSIFEPEAEDVEKTNPNPPKLSAKQEQKNAKCGMGFLLQQLRNSAPSSSSNQKVSTGNEPAEKKKREENPKEEKIVESPIAIASEPKPLKPQKTRENIQLPEDAEFYANLKPIQTFSDCFSEGTTPDFCAHIRRFVGENNYVRSCKWSPDGSWLMTDSVDRFVRVFAFSDDEKKLSLHQKLPFGGLIYDLQLCPNPSVNPHFATTSRGQPIHCWSPDGELACSFRGINDKDELDSAYSLCYSLNGKQLFAGYRNYLRIFDFSRPGKQIREFKTFQKGALSNQKGLVSALAMCPTFDGVFAAANYSGTIGLYSTQTNACDCLIGANNGPAFTHLQYASHGNWIFAGQRKSPWIQCYDLRMPTRLLANFQRAADTSQRFYFKLDPHDRYLYSGSSTGELLVYDVVNWMVGTIPVDAPVQPSHRVKCSTAALTGLCLHPSEQLVAVTTGQRVFPDDVLLARLFPDATTDGIASSPMEVQPAEKEMAMGDCNDGECVEIGEKKRYELDNSLKLYKFC